MTSVNNNRPKNLNRPTNNNRPKSTYGTQGPNHTVKIRRPDHTPANDHKYAPSNYNKFHPFADFRKQPPAAATVQTTYSTGASVGSTQRWTAQAQDRTATGTAQLAPVTTFLTPAPMMFDNPVLQNFVDELRKPSGMRFGPQEQTPGFGFGLPMGASSWGELARPNTVGNFTLDPTSGWRQQN